ncbi:MAG: regulator [Magnetococcales bacterium]|nr:regulator [Magnetococcales bacterium]
MVDKGGNALWVGTSVGVLEIGLDKHEVRNTFTRAQGLANEYVFAIGQDQEGYLWFGTNAGGASRYKDGKWKTYFPMHGLADYWVYSFAQHPKGDFWIGTWAGVNRMDLKSGHMETFVNELVNEWVYAMVIDSKNRIWFGTEGGISRLDGTVWQSWTHKDGLGGENMSNLQPSTNTGLGTRRRHDLGIFNAGEPTYNPNYVFSLALERADVIWAGTWGGGVSRFDGKTWTNYIKKDGLPGNVVYSLVIDQKGRIWAGTDNGIGVFEGGGWKVFPEENVFMNQHFYSITVTPKGEIWAGTRGKVIRIGRANADKE